MPLPKGITIDQIKEALIASAGFQTVAAEMLGCTQSAISHRISKSSKLKKIVKEIREKHLDLAESKLASNIKSGNQKAIEFYLTHKGRDRGYVNKQVHEIEGNPDKPMKIIVTHKNRSK